MLNFFFVFLFFFASFSQASEGEPKGIYYYNLDGDISPIEYLREEAEQGDPVSQRLLAYKLTRMGSMTKESLDWYLASANQGDLYSMISLGRSSVCKIANKCSPDGGYWYDFFEKKAKELASSGNNKAMRALSHYYGLMDDHNKEMEWLEKAAKAGEPRAQYELAGKIENGYGFYWSDSSRNKDVEKWLSKAIDEKFYPATILYSRLSFENEDYNKGREVLNNALYAGYVGSFSAFYMCKDGGFKDPRGQKMFCGDIEKNRSQALGLLLFMSDYGVYTDEKNELEKELDKDQKAEGKKYYQELKSKIPRLFGQRVVY